MFRAKREEVLNVLFSIEASNMIYKGEILNNSSALRDREGTSLSVSLAKTGKDKYLIKNDDMIVYINNPKKSSR